MNELTTKKSEVGKPVEALKTMLCAPSVVEQFKNALGEHKDTFVASLIELFTMDKALQNCKPSLVIGEALRAATLRLPLNKALGFSYIVVFNNSVKDSNGTWRKEPTPTFIPGYKGYIQLAMRTGKYRTINADVVYEGELKKTNKLTGEISFDGEKKSNRIVGYFCYFELINGFSKTLYVTIEDMADYALRYSPSFRGKNKPTAKSLIDKAQSEEVSSKVGWEGNFNDMAIKTVIRKLLSKYGYLSVEMQDAISKDVESDSAVDRNAVIEAEEANVEEVVDVETGEVKENVKELELEAPY